MSPRTRRRAESGPARPAGPASAQPLVFTFPATCEQGAPAADGARSGAGEAEPAPRTSSAAVQDGTRSTQEGRRFSLPRARDDRPEAWGDAPDDLGEALKRERPPHW